MQYFREMSSETEAGQVIEKLNSILGLPPGQRFSDIYFSSINNNVLIADYADNEEAVSLLASFKQYDEDQALKNGFYLGNSLGKYEIIRAKLSESKFLLSTIKDTFDKTNLLVTKSLIYSYAASIYSLYETLEKAVFNMDGHPKSVGLKEWWKKDIKNQVEKKKNELLSYFYIWFCKRYKHEGITMLKTLTIYTFESGSVLQVRLNQSLMNSDFIFSSYGLAAITSSSDIKYLDYNISPTVVGVQAIKHYMEFVDCPKLHLGNEITDFDILNLLGLIDEYFTQVTITFLKAAE